MMMMMNDAAKKASGDSHFDQLVRLTETNKVEVTTVGEGEEG